MCFTKTRFQLPSFRIYNILPMLLNINDSSPIMNRIEYIHTKLETIIIDRVHVVVTVENKNVPF